jgi:cobalt-zinc-cadmium efflux system outer membrane protein
LIPPASRWTKSAFELARADKTITLACIPGHDRKSFVKQMTNVSFALLVAAGGLLSDALRADEPPLAVDARQAYRYALANNPELATARQQRSIASATLLQARTYPFNPYLSVQPLAAIGTPEDGVLRHFAFAGAVTLELEVFGQKAKRVRVAEAGLSRTEWEIAVQEFHAAVRALRAFNTALYRKEKLKLLEDNVRVAEQGIEDAKDVWKKKKEKEPAGEMVLAQFEVQEAKAQLIGGRGPLVAAHRELGQAMGTLQEVTVQGSLELAYRDFREDDLVAMALLARPEMQVRQLAVSEAEARLRLERSNRFGNVTFGPNYQVNESKANFVGASVGLPLPLINRKKGEIWQREAELTKALLEQQQLEIQVRQEVKAALAKLAQVQELLRVYRKEYLPALEMRTLELEKLYAKGGEGVDLQQVLELRRRLLKTRENHLDAVYDHGQIEVDLAAAVGDLELALTL